MLEQSSRASHSSFLKKLASTAILAMLLLISIIPVQAIAQGRNADKGYKRPAASQEKISCQFTAAEKPEYSAKTITTRKSQVPEVGDLFQMEVYVQNTGNMPWFSAQSGCPFLNVSLGSDNQRDRQSIFYTKDLMWHSGWLGANRIAMTTQRVNPGEVGLFRFWSRAPQTDGVYREFFTPVVEGVTWMDSGRVVLDIPTGNADMSIVNNGYANYIQESMELTRANLTGARKIIVDVSEQKMWLKIGDYTIREQPVSSGKRSTPTPYGTTKIFQKQEVRISAARPHYIMPKWMQFRSGGYGIHALPSLANDGGVFWTEALNHIGQPRSHGCIRLLPDDAAFTYEFGIIGTEVSVVP